jgi:hypothetical protein
MSLAGKDSTLTFGAVGSFLTASAFQFPIFISGPPSAKSMRKCKINHHIINMVIASHGQRSNRTRWRPTSLVFSFLSAFSTDADGNANTCRRRKCTSHETKKDA